MSKQNGRSISDNVGSYIREKRELKGLSLKELEELSDISASYINRIENGNRKAPSVPILTNLARCLGIDVADLLELTRNEHEEVISVVDLLLINNYLVNGAEIKREAKDKFVGLIKKILEVDWTENKHKDALEIMELIEVLKVELAS